MKQIIICDAIAHFLYFANLIPGSDHKGITYGVACDWSKWFMQIAGISPVTMSLLYKAVHKVRLVPGLKLYNEWVRFKISNKKKLQRKLEV